MCDAGVPVIVAILFHPIPPGVAWSGVCFAARVDAIICRHWADGSAGIAELAHRVAELADSGQAGFRPLYPDAMPLLEKIETVASKIYHAAEVTAAKTVRDQLAAWEAQGYGHLPVCIAKTQYSFSTDPALRGAPEGHVVNVREVRLSAGAGFAVAITGEIMTMPGLPSSPAAERIALSEQGFIEGLFWRFMHFTDPDRQSRCGISACAQSRIKT
jgi:formate--tetrahydrofolate ligase